MRLTLINKSGDIVRVERWIMSSDIATINSLILQPNAEFVLSGLSEETGKQVSIYDKEYRYIGCLYNEPVSHRKQYYFIERDDYKMEISGETAILSQIPDQPAMTIPPR